MKKLLIWLLILVMCFTLVGCNYSGEPKANKKTTASETTTKPVEKNSEITPLLYKVTDDNGNVIWLFGSIHVGRENYYPLPSYVLEAFNDADSLAVEADIIAFEKDLSLQMDAMTYMLYTDGSTIKDHLPEELYTKAVKILKDSGSYMALLDRYYPVLWSNLIETFQIEKLGGDVNLGIDRHLLEKAYDEDKEILEVESADLQYQMLAGFSEELQILLLEEAVKMYEDFEVPKEELNKMMDLWASGDEEEFANYLNSEDEGISPEDQLLYEEYNQAMIVDRNLSMTDYAENALQSGDEVFICVGAAHVVGEGAMAQLLAQRGYTVECITQ